MQKFDLIKEKELEDFLIKRFGHEEFKGDLNRTARFFSSFKKKFKNIITIGGTNGKGETSTHLANLIKGQGKKTALWTSPHILSIRERFNFSGELATYEELLDEFKSAYQKIKILFGKFSYYEFLFFVFLRLAHRKKSEILILEVGLGGRLDAVNHLDANISAITSLSRDHQSILGNTLHKILSQKLGISRINRPLITAFELEYCRHLATEYCKTRNILYHDLHHLGVLDDSMDYSTKNKLLAAYIFEFFQNKKAPLKIKEADYHFHPLKGRFEEMTIGSISFIFVGSHNIDGIRKLVQKLSLENKSFDGVFLSFSKRPIKEIETILEIFSASFKKVVLTTFDHIKAAKDLKALAEKRNIEFENDWKANIEDKVQTRKSRETYLVTGSYYFVGEVQKFLLSIPSPKYADLFHPDLQINPE